MEKIRVLLADDHPLVLEGLSSILRAEEDIEVVGQARSGEELIRLTEELAPDVVLSDVRMPEMDGVEATRAIKARHPSVQVVILTVCEDESYIFRAVKAGALGYILKDVATNQLARAVRLAARGESMIDPAIAARVLQEFTKLSDRLESGSVYAQLTAREMETLRLVASGASNKEIAKALSIGEKTVKNHLSSIFAKLQVNDRTQALIYALRHGMVSLS
ncbi:MAG TPA: response regulator transcription factor [Armatimonadota bacterium]|jgi:DNA-binding NarL/FixJ family response regulator